MRCQFSKKNIMVLGASGMLGENACRYFSERNANVFAVTRRQQKFTQNNIKLISTKNENIIQYQNIIKKYPIDVVLNCIGIANIEECENNPDKAFEINSKLPGLLAQACLEKNIKFIHISTDHYLHKNSVYLKEDDNDFELLNIYAKSKREGELNVMANYKSALVVRTNFFGKSKSSKISFSDYIINNISNGKYVYLFEEVFHTPIDMFGLLEAINKLYNSYNGIINVCSDRKISKYELGKMIAKTLDLDTDYVVPCLRSKRVDLVMRPNNMSLCCKRLKKILPSIDFTIEAILKRLLI